MKNLLQLAVLLLFSISLTAQNYDEAKIPPYTLPDPLKAISGKRIKTESTWEKMRRPEVLKLFGDNIYGQMPERYDSIRYSVTEEDKPAIDGKAKLKQVLVEIFNSHKSVKINLVLFTPLNSGKQLPVFLLINNRGKENTDPTRAKKSGFWPAELLIDAGYAIAAFHVDDLAPDNKTDFTNGVLQLYPEQLKMANGMRAIGAWAWGASRILDYLETDPSIDSKRVIVVGHSRGGKASLWAAANDQRFSMCVSNCSGNTGLALARRQFGERISNINTSFPYWFTDNYKKYNDKENALPVDQHMLAALIAPRPLYGTNASKDLWADPKGTYLSLKNAEKVYALFGIKSALPGIPPGVNDPVVNSVLGYHNREGIHDLTEYDWMNFIKFADYNFAK